MFWYLNNLFVFTVPPDFSYLPENSFIRAAIDFAIESGKKGKKGSNYSIPLGNLL